MSKYRRALQSTKVEEMQAEAKLKTDHERQTLLGNALALLSPLVLAKVFKTPIDAAAVAGPAVGAFMTSLTKEQESALLGALDAPQQLAFMEMLKARNAAAAGTKRDAGSESSAAGFAASAGETPPTPPPMPAPDGKADPSFDVDKELERITRFANQHTAEFLQWLGKLEVWARRDASLAANDASAASPASPADDAGATT